MNRGPDSALQPHITLVGTGCGNSAGNIQMSGLGRFPVGRTPISPLLGVPELVLLTDSRGAGASGSDTAGNGRELACTRWDPAKLPILASHPALRGGHFSHSPRQAHTEIGDCIEALYNARQHHSALGYPSPALYEAHYGIFLSTPGRL